MVLPALLAAAPYIGYGLMGAASLFSMGTSLWNLGQQREMYHREEDFSKSQSEDWNRWLSDYERNTGVRPHYRYLGQSGQAEYLRSVRIPNYANLYSSNTASAWGAGARGAIGLGFAGQGAYNKWYNSGYRVAPIKDISTHPEVM